MKYLILQNPGHNRVYYNSADKLAISELQIATESLSVDCTQIKIEYIHEVRYLSFKTNEKLSEVDLAVLSRLSFVFVLFSMYEGYEGLFLKPVSLFKYNYINDKVNNLLKYKGKTNELFTNMMINVALLSSDFNYNDDITLLDPVAGKGTTLFEAAVNGFNAFGVEIESKAVNEAIIFFKKFLQDERFKFKFDKRRIFGSNKKEEVLINDFVYAKNKQDLKTNAKKLSLVCGNSQDTYKYFKSPVFNIIVGDLPYGIVHSNSSINSQGMRNPIELLKSCLSGWYKVLKFGGTIVMAWNSFLISKEKLADMFINNGFTVLTDEAYSNFEHMVDKSIKRDIIVAKKIKKQR